MITRVSILAVLTVVSGLFYLGQHAYLLSIPAYDFGSATTVHANDDAPRDTILFVGDIMLGRGVETLMRERGSAFPFARITPLIEEASMAVGNFEASVPQEHRHTPDFNMQFSVRAEYLAQLVASGFDTLSLANNHALDHGADGYTHTRNTCDFYELMCAGHPQRIDHTSVYYHDLSDTRIGILMLNDTTDSIDRLELGVQLSKMEFYSDIQVAYIHWGEEYTHERSRHQQKLAYSLIDNGIDVVIGHHPHVVQGLELYNGKPIFYSLGNFVFDQYFSDAVQNGLAVRMEVYDESITYRLQGITSSDVPSQPRRINEEELGELLETVAAVSESNVRDAVLKGTVEVTR